MSIIYSKGAQHGLVMGRTHNPRVKSLTGRSDTHPFVGAAQSGLATSRKGTYDPRILSQVRYAPLFQGFITVRENTGTAGRVRESS